MTNNQLILSSIDKNEFRQWIQSAIVEELNRKSVFVEKQQVEELLTRKDVAKIFKTSLVTLRQWEKDGKIPKPFRKGTRVFFRKSDIIEDIERRDEI